jgi:hypothetical protein
VTASARLAAGCTLVACVVQLAIYQYQLARAPVPADLITPAQAAFAALHVDLPATGTVGFVPTLADPNLASASFFVAQYALAPHVLALDLDDARIVIAGPTASAATDADPRLLGFTFVGERSGGIEGGSIRLYRRAVQ